MLVEAPVGHVADSSLDPAEIDWCDFTWAECFQRALRKRSRNGREFRVLLKIGTTLRHGDVLIASSQAAPAVAVNVLPCEVLVARPRDITELAAAAFKLGDLHVPAQLDGDRIITIPDGPTEAALTELAIPFEIQHRRFEPTLRSTTEITISNTFKITSVKPT